MQAAFLARLVRNMSDDWKDEENAKMESCQSKDDKCGGKVEQIFSSEKEKKEPWVDFAYWKMLKVMYDSMKSIKSTPTLPPGRSTWVQYIMSMSWDSIISNQCFALNLFCRSVISN